MRRKVKSAFAYPIIVGMMCFTIVAILVTFVIPVFEKLYSQLHVTLPGPTLFLITISHAVKMFWWLIILLGFGCVAVFRRLKTKPAFKAKLDAFKLNMPVFSKLNRMVVVSRFVRCFAMQSEAGVPIIEALDIANSVVSNVEISKITARIQQSIGAGQSLVDPMKEFDIFPPMIVQLAASGEEAGVLPEMLNKGVDFLDKDIERAIAALLVKLEPALTIIMGLITGVILMGVYLPMFDYMGHLK